jgi:hypothetical protein
VERERLVFRLLADVPLDERLKAVERIIADDPHMPKKERARLRALAHYPGVSGGRICEAPDGP